jgi:rhamnosyltransferase
MSEPGTSEPGPSEPTVDVTVTILTYNGEQYLEQILDAVAGQRLEGRTVEVLVIDSGSRDRTLDIVRRRPEVRLHEIPNSEFGHGRTRNLAARLARGRYVAYLTHDAVPATDRWLHELLAPFAIDDRIVAVMGKQVPRPHCFPLLKYEIRGVFAGFGPDFGTTLFYKDDFIQSQGVADAVGFYSDVNSCARRDVLLGAIPYRDVAYAEDQLFGRDVVEAGLIKAYAGRAAVVHSNDLTLAEYRRRLFDETVGLHEIGLEPRAPGPAETAKLLRAGILRDTLRILRDPDYSWKRKLYWLAMNPRFHAAKWQSIRRALAVDLTDAEVRRRHSLEESRKA